MRPADPAQPMDTLLVSTCNTLNLALPGRVFYPNQDAYTQAEFERKADWLGGRFRALNADVLAVQEVWDEQAFQTAIGRSGLRYDFVSVPGAENAGALQGAQGTPRVGLATRLRVESVRSIGEFPPALAVDVPGLGTHHQFERPPLLATLRMKHGQTVNVVTAHLKSKRPKFLLDALGQPLEDRDDRKVAALASLRSLIMRGVEAAALRCLVVDLLQRTDVPLVLLGDFNDTPDSVTTQAHLRDHRGRLRPQCARCGAVQRLRRARRCRSQKDVAYSHIHQGMPAVLDQILVSEEFVPNARSGMRLGDVRRVDYFNDHLHEGRDRTRSDHGFVRALLRLPAPAVP